MLIVDSIHVSEFMSPEFSFRKARALSFNSGHFPGVSFLFCHTIESKNYQCISKEFIMWLKISAVVFT